MRRVLFTVLMSPFVVRSKSVVLFTAYTASFGYFNHSYQIAVAKPKENSDLFDLIPANWFGAGNIFSHTTGSFSYDNLVLLSRLAV